MPRVYRHQWSNGRRSVKWYVEYRDHAGKLHREPAYRDKGLSLNHLAEILKREERIKAGIIEPHEGRPSSPIDDLIGRWESHQLGKGFGVKHVRLVRRQVEIVCRGCKFFDERSLNGARAQDFLEALIANGRTNRTYMQYRASLLTFGSWLSKKEKILAANPFAGIDTRNIELNRKIVRRVLSETEFRKFLETTRSGPKRAGLSGEQRYWLYTIAGYTGLRLAACLALTPRHFTLGKSASVTSAITVQKNRKAHTIPLPADVAAGLRKWFKDMPLDVPIWKSGDGIAKKGARLVRFDLARAKIPFKTSDGQFDFHSLRHTFATALVRAGANAVEVQHLLDHSSPALSARYFKHLKTDELRGPVNRLPKL